MYYSSSLVPRPQFFQKGSGHETSYFHGLLENPLHLCIHLFTGGCSSQPWGDGPFPASTEAVGLQLSNSAGNGVSVSEGVCPPWPCRTKYPAYRGICVQGRMNWQSLTVHYSVSSSQAPTVQNQLEFSWGLYSQCCCIRLYWLTFDLSSSDCRLWDVTWPGWWQLLYLTRREDTNQMDLAWGVCMTEICSNWVS